MDSQRLKNVYKSYMLDMRNIQKTQGVSDNKLSGIEKDLKNKTIKTLDLMIEYTSLLGYNLKGIFDRTLIYDKASITDTHAGMYLHVDALCKSLGMTEDKLLDVAKVTPMQKKIFKSKGDIKFTTLIQILNVLKISVLDFSNYMLTIAPRITDERVLAICNELSLLLKKKRLRNSVKLATVSYHGNISQTTARRIEQDCSKVHINKFINYATIVGFDPLNIVGKNSSSSDPDIRVIELYNCLSKYRLVSEISQGTIASQLNMSIEKVQRCENFRADISVFKMIKWLITLMVFDYSYRNQLS